MGGWVGVNILMKNRTGVDQAGYEVWSMKYEVNNFDSVENQVLKFSMGLNGSGGFSTFPEEENEKEKRKVCPRHCKPPCHAPLATSHM